MIFMNKLNLPNIWGHGAIFAYSGLEGECHFNESLVGTLGEDGLNIKFRNGDNAFLHIDIEGLVNLFYDAVLSDTISASALYKDGSRHGLDILFVSQNIIAVRGKNVTAKLVYIDDVNKQTRDNVTVYTGAKNKFVLSSRTENGVTTSVLCFGENAEELINTGFSAEIEEIKAKRLKFFAELPHPDFKDAAEEMLYYKCFSIMRSMVYTPEQQISYLWTTPDRFPHKAMWLWDTAYHTVGMKHISTDLAKQSIKAMLQFEHKNGFLPHMVMPTWQSSVTQPPTLSWAALEVYKSCGDKKFLEEVFEPLCKYLQWDIDNRDINGNGLPEWQVDDDPLCRCGESGMDNTPRFDEAEEMDCVDFAGFLANDMNCLAEIAGIIGKEKEQKLWYERFEAIKKKANELLWDSEDNFYYDRRVSDGKFHKVKSAASFILLFAGVCSDEQAKHMVEHLKNPREFGTAFPIPTVSADDKTYPTKDMFRGTVWTNFNYLTYLGLKRYGFEDEARELMDKTVEIAKKWFLSDGVLYEFYDSTDEVSPKRLSRKDIALQPYMPEVRSQAVRDFSWISSFTADYIINRDKNGRQ